MSLIVGFIIIFMGYLLSSFFESKYNQVLLQGVDIEDFDDYIKIKDVKSYIKESDLEELIINDTLELLKYGEMLEIKVTIFAKERMISCDDLEYLLKDGLIYRDGYLLNEVQEEMAENHNHMAYLIKHLFLMLGVSVAIIMSSFGLFYI